MIPRRRTVESTTAKGATRGNILHFQFLHLSSEYAARGVKRLFSFRNILALAIGVGSLFWAVRLTSDMGQNRFSGRSKSLGCLGRLVRPVPRLDLASGLRFCDSAADHPRTVATSGGRRVFGGDSISDVVCFARLDPLIELEVGNVSWLASTLVDPHVLVYRTPVARIHNKVLNLAFCAHAFVDDVLDRVLTFFAVVDGTSKTIWVELVVLGLNSRHRSQVAP